MTTTYEWDVETVTTVDSDEHEVGEVLDHFFCQSYAQAMTEAEKDAGEGMAYRIVLVRDADEGRMWAYVEESKLPDWFRDAYDNSGTKVPQRFHDEVSNGAGAAA